MKYFLLLSILVSTTCYSQVKNDSASKAIEGCFALSGGYGKPVGDYGSMDVLNDNTGWAKPGANYGAFYVHGIHKYLGVAAMFRYTVNPRDPNAAAEYQTQNYPAYLITASSNSWKLKVLMLGMQVSVPLVKSKKLSANFKCMPGIAFVTYPELTYSIKQIQGNYQGLIRIEETTSKAFAYLIGVGLKYDISYAISVVFQADYLASNPQFQYTESGSGYIGVYNDTFFKKIQLLSFDLGIGLRIH